MAYQQELSLVMTMNFVSTTGKFNGSSLTILGRNAMFHPIRVMPIIGGACAFRLARGFVQGKTHFFNLTSAHCGVPCCGYTLFSYISGVYILFQRTT